MKSSTVTLYLVMSALTALLFVSGFTVQYLSDLGADISAGSAMRLVLAAGIALVAAQTALVLRSMVARLKRDHARLEELSLRLDQMQTIDELTKAYNRKMLEQVLDREVEEVRRYGTKLAGVMFDVDGFREINEQDGYRAGDRLLARLAAVVHRHIRKTDFLFRWRGGRFIILAAHVDLPQAAQFAEKLRRVVEKTDLGGGKKVTVSLGVGLVQADDGVDSFVARLKKALAQAKQQGRNRLQSLAAG